MLSLSLKQFMKILGGEGFTTTMMLISTLIPTLIHIVLGFTAVVIHYSPSALIVDCLRVDDPEKATNTRPMVASLSLVAIPFIITPASVYGLYLLYTLLPLGEWLSGNGCWMVGVGCS